MAQQKQLHNVQGTVQKVGAYPLKEPKPNPFEEGKMNTHRLALQLDDGNYYGFGETDKDVFLAKEPSTQDHKILGKGSQVFLMYTLSDCGKYRNAKKANLTVTNFVEGERFQASSQPAGNTSGGAPKGNGGSYDLTGVKVGHAVNAAMLLLNDKPNSPAQLVEVANSLHTISVTVEAAYKGANPQMSARDVGAASGHAILNACKMTDKIEEVEKKAKSLLSKVIPAVTAHVKGEAAPAQPPAGDDGKAEEARKAKEAAETEAKNKAAKAKAAKEAKAKKEAEEAAAKAAAEKPATPEGEDGFDGFEDMNEDFDDNVDF